jgi:hypothetical protein
MTAMGELSSPQDEQKITYCDAPELDYQPSFNGDNLEAQPNNTM